VTGSRKRSVTVKTVSITRLRMMLDTRSGLMRKKATYTVRAASGVW
jgi:hypothetical protein